MNRNQHRRFSVTAAALGIGCVALLCSEVAWAELKGPKNIKANRDQVEKACDSSGGIAWGTQGSGDYGCVTDNALIMCKKDSKCQGWTVEKASVRPLPTSISLWAGVPEVAAVATSTPANILDQMRELDRRRLELVREYETVLPRTKGVETMAQAYELRLHLERIARDLDSANDQREVLGSAYAVGK
jgi:hypothetical protein